MDIEAFASPQIFPLMIPQFAPAWAEVFGEDDFGIFTEFSLKGTSFVLRWIPPGRFLMGSPESELGRQDNEGPQHAVTLSRGFWLGETPVTQLQWIAVWGDNPSRFTGDEWPVERVDWHQSLEFAERLSYAIPGLAASLPTEAQWEYACRADTQAAFHDGSACTLPEGDDPALDQLGWFDANSKQHTHPVKEKLPNAWGLYDMHGNVWEWCLDGMRNYIDQSEHAPLGQIDEGAFRVVRGGSWRDSARDCRAATRDHLDRGFDWVAPGLRLSAGHEPD